MKKYDIVSKIDENCCGFYEWNKPLYLLSFEDDRVAEFKKQKRKYGFSDDETWSLYTSTVIFFLPRIKRFRKIINDCGCRPANLKDKNEWLEILDKIILSFELMYKEDIDGESISNEEQNQINEGLKLFGEYFQALWW